MPGTLRINVSGNSASSGAQELLDHVRSNAANVRHETRHIDAGDPAPQVQLNWPDVGNCLYMLLVFGIPDADGGEVEVEQNGFNSIFTADLPTIASGDHLLALIPRQNVGLLPPLIDISATVDIDTIDIYFL